MKESGLHRPFVDPQKATIVELVRLRELCLRHHLFDGVVASCRPDQLINLPLDRRDPVASGRPLTVFAARGQSPAAVKRLKGWIVLNALQAAPATASPIASIPRAFSFGVISLLSKS
jgi:hypothetical protein